MKTFNKIFMSLGIATLALGAGSCVGDLDLEPTNPNEITDVKNNIDEVFADVYLNFSTFGANGNSPVSGFDGGMAAFQRALFIAEEIPTDEASWLWDPGSYGTMNYGRVTPSIDAVFGFYSRLMINISLCNQFIAGVDNYSKPDNMSDDAWKTKKEEFVRQAKVLRSGCYYYMLSFYDKVPYADENTDMGSLPTQMSRKEVYTLVTSTLEDIVAEYKAIDPNQKPYYGFVGLDVAESILAKIYLNGEVFAGQADYAKCLEHCEAIIGRIGNGGYYGNGLARSYNALFGYNNSDYCNSKENGAGEIIWTLAQDRVHLLSWSGATFMCVGWLGTNGVQVTATEPKPEDYNTEEEYKKAKEAYDKLNDWEKTVGMTFEGTNYSLDPSAAGQVSTQWYNCSSGWKCMVARKTFVGKFEWDDEMKSISRDRRVSLWQTSSHNFVNENPTLVGDDWGNNGYLAVKYSNWAYNEDGTINKAASPEPTEQIGGDYAVIRLAEIYLTAAECILKGGGGTQAQALKYVNYIRQRAYGDDYEPWTSLNMSALQDERCRELYTENNRRTDLIRWNLWCTGYNWEWKGGIAGGTNLPEYTKLYPIPTRVMVSSNFEQTTGY